MPRKLLKKLSPDQSKLMQSGFLKRFNDFAHRAPIWHLNRKSATRAALIGFFCALIPLPIQMFIAIFFCIFARANLPLTMAIVWLTNPLTMPPVFYATYRLGAFMLGVDHIPLNFEMSWDWLVERLFYIWKPLFLGSLTAGVFCSALAYTLLDLLWRRHTLKRWRNRHKKD